MKQILLLIIVSCWGNVLNAQESVVNKLINMSMKTFVVEKFPDWLTDPEGKNCKCVYMENLLPYNFCISEENKNIGIIQNKYRVGSKMGKIIQNECGWNGDIRKNFKPYDFYIENFSFFLMEDTLFCISDIEGLSSWHTPHSHRRYLSLKDNIITMARLDEDNHWSDNRKYDMGLYMKSPDYSLPLHPREKEMIWTDSLIDKCLQRVKNNLFDQRGVDKKRVWLIEDFFPHIFYVNNVLGTFDLHVPRGRRLLSYKKKADYFVGYPLVAFDGNKMTVSVSCFKAKDIRRNNVQKLVEDNKATITYTYNRNSKQWEETDFLLTGVLENR